jgi:hypothetical protein
MKTMLIRFYFISLLLCLANAGCKKSEQKNEPETKWDSPIRLLGNRIPSSVIMGNNSIALITFVNSNLTYKFDLNRIDANYFWGRLIEAQKNATAVKVYITSETQIVRID